MTSCFVGAVRALLDMNLVDAVWEPRAERGRAHFTGTGTGTGTGTDTRSNVHSDVAVLFHCPQ